MQKFSEGEDTKSKEADGSKSVVIMNRKLSGRKKYAQKMCIIFRRLTFLFKITFIYTLTYEILRFSEEQNFVFLDQNHQKHKK